MYTFMYTLSPWSLGASLRAAASGGFKYIYFSKQDTQP